ncbi:MAG: hypothetical protein OXH99_06460 [Bryobacterales bacterium]|nr:hypothetical protein [Bryobacterales bacterium]
MEHRLNLPVNPDSALTGIRADQFDSSGFLRRDRYKQFGRIMVGFAGPTARPSSTATFWTVSNG